MNRSSGKHNKGAILLLEEAVQLLRQMPLHVFFGYYCGSIPFILALLYFWADMSHSAYAQRYSAIAAMGLAALFGWMKIRQAIFGYQIKSLIAGQTQERWRIRHLLSLAATQTLLHSSGLFLLPISLVLMVPVCWCYAFYQNVTVQSDPANLSVKRTVARALRQAGRWPGQNHFLLVIVLLAGMVVLINLGVAIFIIPFVLKKLLGVESIFTLSGVHSFNSTFAATAIGLAYLGLDPLVKAAYALRCFYGEAISSGADIRLALRSYAVQAKLTAVCLICFCLSFIPAGALAFNVERLAIKPGELRTISSQDLDRCIDEVLQRPEFSWRLPKGKINAAPSGPDSPLAVILKWMSDGARKVFKRLTAWIEKIVEWFDQLSRKKETPADQSPIDWRRVIRTLFFVLLIGTGLVCIYYLWTILRKQRPAPAEIESPRTIESPDLEDEHIKADDLPVNGWLELSQELFDKGSIRLALRALYLATLAYLGEKDLLNIAFYKSNHDYKNELDRRAHQNRELLVAFAETVRIFDGAWYGMQQVKSGDFDRYRARHERIMALVEK